MVWFRTTPNVQHPTSRGHANASVLFLLSIELAFQVISQNRQNVDRTRIACVDILMRIYKQIPAFLLFPMRISRLPLFAISHEYIGIATLQASFGESTWAGGGEGGWDLGPNSGA